MYSKSRGRPSIPPSVIVRGLLLAAKDQTSDRESARCSRVDLDWKADARLGRRSPRYRRATTFSLMRARFVLHEADRNLLAKTVEKAVERGLVPRHVLALVDSSPCWGRARRAGHLRPAQRSHQESRASGKRGQPVQKELARMVEAARLLLDAAEGRPEAKESAELLGVSTRWGASRRWRWPLRPEILSFVRRETAPRSVMGACAPCRADFGPSAGGFGCTRVDRGRECHSLAGSHHLHPRGPDYREHHHGGAGRGGCPSGAGEVGAPLTPRQRVILPYRG